MKHKVCILIIALMIVFPIIVSARYFEKIENIKGKAKIAEPIFKVENIQDTIVQTINKESVVNEYVFKIKNYELESGGTNKRISQVDMIYNIEIINEKENFPAEFLLSEINSTENLLQGNSKTKDFDIYKDNEYEKTYKLVVCWKDKEGNLDSNNNIKIIINSSQKK